MKPVACTLLGYGNAARALVRLLSEQETWLLQNDIQILVTGIATRNHGIYLVPEGLTPRQLLSRSVPYPDLPRFHGDSVNLVRDSPSQVVFEVTPLEVTSGEPALTHIRTALATGKHVITANKGPIAWAFRELSDLALSTGKGFFYETTVMDGAPVFNMVEKCLPGCQITGFTGILNSTTNFILDRMMQGHTLESALSLAQQKGFAEANPDLDLDGWDAACKVSALMNVWMKADVNPNMISRQGIRHVDPEYLVSLRSRGLVLKLLCEASGPSPRGEVRLAELPERSEMGQVRGTTSCLRISTDLMGDITIIEHEPGIQQTAYGLYSDLLQLLCKEGVLQA